MYARDFTLGRTLGHPLISNSVIIPINLLVSDRKMSVDVNGGMLISKRIWIKKILVCICTLNGRAMMLGYQYISN